MPPPEAINAASVGKKLHVHLHPLDPLTSNEISAASAVIRASYPPGSPLHFKAVSLEEPPKSLLVPYLEAEHGGRPRPFISRIAYVLYVTLNTSKTWEALVDLSTRKLIGNVQIPHDCQAAADAQTARLEARPEPTSRQQPAHARRAGTLTEARESPPRAFARRSSHPDCVEQSKQAAHHPCRLR